jgi:hypothetical protein
LERAKKSKYRNPWLFTPNWESILHQLSVLGNDDEHFSALPAIAHGQTTWGELIDRLVIIQKERGYRPSWVIQQCMDRGNPPFEALVRLAKNGGFISAARWAAKNWKGSEDEDEFLLFIDLPGIGNKPPEKSNRLVLTARKI